MISRINRPKLKRSRKLLSFFHIFFVKCATEDSVITASEHEAKEVFRHWSDKRRMVLMFRMIYICTTGQSLPMAK